MEFLRNHNVAQPAFDAGPASARQRNAFQIVTHFRYLG